MCPKMCSFSMVLHITRNILIGRFSFSYRDFDEHRRIPSDTGDTPGAQLGILIFLWKWESPRTEQRSCADLSCEPLILIQPQQGEINPAVHQPLKIDPFRRTAFDDRVDKSRREKREPHERGN